MQNSHVWIYRILFIVFSVAVALFLVIKIEYENFAEPVTFIFQNKKVKQVSVFVGGDIMLDRGVKRQIDKNGFDYLFKNIKEEIQKADIAVANLEGIFSGNESIALKNNEILRFTFDPKIISILTDAGFDALSQANNHTYDFGEEGQERSFEYLTSSNIYPFGDYMNEKGRVALFEKNGFKIAFVGFNEFPYKNFDNILAEITNFKSQGYMVFVMPHWGVEYEKFPSSLQKKLAREFIDSGADAIFGAHPHVIQIIEFYKEKPIFYSLGNFIFDQNFSKQTTEGLALDIKITKDETLIKLLPFDIPLSQPVFMNDLERLKFLEEFGLPEEIKLKNSP